MTWDDMDTTDGSPGDEEAVPDEEAAVDEVMGDNPRADRLKSMLASLLDRRALLVRERDSASSQQERERWEARIAETDRQIAAVRQEEAVARFVESSVRLAVRRSGEEDAM
jgi:hypothetical protein